MSILEWTPCLRLIKRLADDSAEILKALFPNENIKEDIEDGSIGLKMEDMDYGRCAGRRRSWRNAYNFFEWQLFIISNLILSALMLSLKNSEPVLRENRMLNIVVKEKIVINL